jgi:hypothetical protein
MDHKQDDEKMTTVHIPVLNSLLFIRDPKLVELPVIGGTSAAWSTTACVAVSCLPDCDGPTTITIDPIERIKSDDPLLFEGTLQTPSRKVIVETVLAEKILEMAVPCENSRICIWTDGRRDTKRIVIGLG